MIGQDLEIEHIPLRIIGRISKESRENPSRDSVSTVNEDSVLVCFHKFVVQNEKPNSLNELRFAEAKHFRTWRFAVMRDVFMLQDFR